MLSHSCLHQVAFALGPSLLDLNFFSPLEDGPNIIPQPVTNTTTEVGVVHLTGTPSVATKGDTCILYIPCGNRQKNRTDFLALRIGYSTFLHLNLGAAIYSMFSLCVMKNVYIYIEYGTQE